MNAYNERERAIENKFAHDAELRFKLQARCNKATALWLAGKMRYTPEAAQAYAQEILSDTIHTHDKEQLIARLITDTKSALLSLSAKEITDKMDELYDDILRNM